MYTGVSISSLAELKARIVSAVCDITDEMLENTWRLVPERLMRVKSFGGGHIEL